MTEKRFLSYVLTEGILLTILGLAMLMLPKVTTITFGMTAGTKLLMLFLPETTPATLYLILYSV